MRIAVFDYKVIPNNPIGSCHLRMMNALCREHSFVVFAVEFENPDPQRIRFVRVPCPTRPLFLLFLTYHLLAPICYLILRLRGNARFDLIQTVESCSLLRADIVYSQFCHRRYLKAHWPLVRRRNIRGFLSWLNHFLYRLAEPRVYRRCGRVIVPSRGLARELQEEYPFLHGRVQVLANPVEPERMQPAADFHRLATREQAGFSIDDFVLVFVALGHFERKGLPLILQAMSDDLPERVKLNVVGGKPDLINTYRRIVERMGLSNRVIFSGTQRDIRPMLWSADAFVFPSFYETFSLVTFESAAAGLPVVVSPLHGVEDFLVDGENGILIEPSAFGVARGVKRLMSLTDEEQSRLIQRAQLDVRQYAVDRFVSRWRDVYRQHSATIAQPAEAQAIQAAIDEDAETSPSSGDM